MRTGSQTQTTPWSRPSSIAELSHFLAALFVLAACSVTAAGETKRVLVVYPTSDGQPGILRFQESFWLGLMNGPISRIEVWQVIGAIAVCAAEALLIAGLLWERANRRRAEEGLRKGQIELRNVTGRLLQAQETERRRIALELHDDLNQSLALLAIDLDLLGQNPPVSAALLGERMHELSGRVKQLSSEVHELSHQLHPTKVEQLGLVVGVRSLCGELSHAHGLEIDFTAKQVTSTISADASLCLYRVTQEALRNVIKHSGARHARVELRGSPDAISLWISDDGCGFDTGSADRKGGLGLVSMRERLRLVGGDIAILSRAGGGVEIEVRIPIDPSSINRREDASHGAPTGV